MNEDAELPVQHVNAAAAVFPVVRVMLGDSLSVLREGSTLLLPDGAGSTTGNIVITTAAQLSYGPRDRLLRFPPGLFLSLLPMAGHVVEIRASPHVHALTLDEAIELTQHLGEAASAAGWRRTSTLASPDSVRHAVAGLSTEAIYKQPVSMWRAGEGDEMYLSVQRIKSAEDVRSANAAFGRKDPERDLFLVDVYLSNGPVFSRYAAIDRAQ